MRMDPLRMPAFRRMTLCTPSTARPARNKPLERPSIEAITKPQGGVVRAEILRKSGPLTVDLRYPHNEVPAAQLRQQVANPGQQNAAEPSAAPAPAAPPSGVHFGIQVRPVIADDMAPLQLTKAQGLVVVGVENGSLADTMGILAGDVILQVNGADVGDMQQFAQTIRSGAAKTSASGARDKLWNLPCL
jgi:membrane-associated protease RseP (regulator of RpoE activity)